MAAILKNSFSLSVSRVQSGKGPDAPLFPLVTQNFRRLSFGRRSPVISPFRMIAAITDLRSSILSVISVAVPVPSPAVPIAVAISHLPSMVIVPTPLIIVATPVHSYRCIVPVLCLYRTTGRQPEKRSSQKHCKNHYCSFHNIHSPVRPFKLLATPAIRLGPCLLSKLEG